MDVVPIQISLSRARARAVLDQSKCSSKQSLPSSHN